MHPVSFILFALSTANCQLSHLENIGGRTHSGPVTATWAALLCDLGTHCDRVYVCGDTWFGLPFQTPEMGSVYRHLVEPRLVEFSPSAFKG